MSESNTKKDIKLCNYADFTDFAFWIKASKQDSYRKCKDHENYNLFKNVHVSRSQMMKWCANLASGCGVCDGNNYSYNCRVVFLFNMFSTYTFNPITVLYRDKHMIDEDIQ